MAEKKLMYGNHALVEGVIYAGCRFFAGYPITPQNEIPEYMSIRMNAIGGVFLQTESELAAINMLFGVASTGARAMTSSSSTFWSLIAIARCMLNRWCVSWRGLVPEDTVSSAVCMIICLTPDR